MWSAREKSALVESLTNAGPDAPTLCEGWQTRHLAAHLMLRGNEPWRLVPRPWAPDSADRLIDDVSEGLREPTAYAAAVAAFAAGPVGANPMRLVGGRADEAMNLLEYLVHHEDVRRAGPDPLPPRELPVELTGDVWRRAGQFSKFAYRSAPVGVVQVVPEGPRRRVRAGAVSVALTGAPLEQTLFAMGRRDAARVRITGAPDAVAEFEAWAAG
ncbi:TIGR03085 family protein [Occultella glacieicola]|uniref:TIGR03085 family protein n=1 Tax=Occultella glacieicola TaxID=2518684 RepID=A0ABY2E046_9MICO|nr:TIGR03085 family metal-binding protein [Occultella glacieicola]TDE90372.1 TIGR03085 family protein [Occultella glacieicola]